MHLAPRVALNPTGNYRASPRPTIGWKFLQSLVKLGLLLVREEAYAPRIAMAAGAQALETLVLGAMG